MTAKKLGAHYFVGPIEDRLARYSYSVKSGCIIWFGALTMGYGCVWHQKKRRKAHVVAYEIVNGPVPDGFELHHTCMNRNCINPAHLQPVTRGQHQILEPRRFVGDVTHCKQGHAFDAENTRINRNGRRSCRKCHALWQRGYVARKKARG